MAGTRPTSTARCSSGRFLPRMGDGICFLDGSSESVETNNSCAQSTRGSSVGGDGLFAGDDERRLPMTTPERGLLDSVASQSSNFELSSSAP